MSSGEYENDRDALIREVKQKAREKEQASSELVEAVADDYKAPVAETKFSVGEGNAITLDIRQRLHGDFIDRLENIEARVSKFEADPEEHDTRLIGDTAEDAAELLADMTVDSRFDKSAFYDVYRKEGLDALGVYLESAGEAIEREVKRQQGEADGFR